MKRGADAHWLMEGPPDREKKHSKSLIRTGCFGHSAAYGAFYAVRDVLLRHASNVNRIAYLVRVLREKDAGKMAENGKNKNDFCHKRGDML